MLDSLVRAVERMETSARAGADGLTDYLDQPDVSDLVAWLKRSEAMNAVCSAAEIREKEEDAWREWALEFKG